jgi:hypothetical protein
MMLRTSFLRWAAPRGVKRCDLDERTMGCGNVPVGSKKMSTTAWNLTTAIMLGGRTQMLNGEVEFLSHLLTLNSAGFKLGRRC